MDGLEYWLWCEELSVFQAAMLSVGVDPASEIGSRCEEWKVHERPHGYEAAKAGISNALRNNRIKGRLIPEFYYDINGNPCGEIDESVSVHASWLDVASLKEWMTKRGLRPLFFFPTATESPDYLDPKHPRYSGRLAASIMAWLAMEDENLLTGKSAKDSMEKWIESRYKEFGLIHQKSNEKNGYKAGDMNKSAIADSAKVANWNEDGGAPKTPG